MRQANVEKNMKFTRVAEKAANIMLVAAVFSLVLPTAWVSLFLVLFAVFWVLSGQFKKKWERVRTNPAALASLSLFVLYGVGTLYSQASWQEAISVWNKYHKLLFIPIIISFLDDPIWRRRAAEAFLLGMLLVLTISYMKWLGWYPHEHVGQGYFVFKGRIAHNIFMAFTVYLLLQKAYVDVSRRWLWAAVALLATVNIFFMVNSRTGQLILPFVMIFFVIQRLGWRIGLGAVLAGSFTFAAAVSMGNPEQFRLLQINQEIETHQSNSSIQTSSGIRLDFYRNTFELVMEHPWIGWGTGSMRKTYAEHAERNGLALKDVPNPHNEYLLVAQQLGLLGLAMMIMMGWLHWRAARELDSVDGGRLQALILVIGIGSLFNSLLLDAGEGKFYCLMAGIYLSGRLAPVGKEQA